MIEVGITGGIGSGKSTICRIFEALEIHIYYADEKAKTLINSNKTLIESIKNLFGPGIYDLEGQLNSKKLADIVFKNKSKLTQLNNLVHPYVKEDYKKWVKEQSEKAQPYIIKEAALLIESGTYKDLDKLIVVTAPEKLRIDRVIKRDKVSEEEVRDRMNNQLPEKDKVALADFIIENDEKQMLLPQVLKIHQSLIDAS